MANHMRMNKVPEYPRPHDIQTSWSMPVESAAVRHTTIYPIITQDEGLGAMSAYESNPANASHVQANSAHCFPTSKIDNIFCKLQVSMSKVMLETDKKSAVVFETALIHTAFDEGAQALDEVSTLDVNEIMELQSEATDRQTFPIFNAIDLHDYKLNAFLDVSAEQLGLTADVELEGVVWSREGYYDALQHFTNQSKLRAMVTPLKQHMLTRQHPVKDIYFKQQSNTKYMNPFAFLGILIHVPQMADRTQIGEVGDTTIETSVLHFTTSIRYLEHNHEFNHSLL